MSRPVLISERELNLNDTRQPALWGSLIAFLVINNIAIAGRLWGTWVSVTSRSRVMAEDICIILSGIFVDAIIANLMVATHYGLGLHADVVVERDPNSPSELSNALRHVWITMVLMPSYFTCIKMTLLFFYKRMFLVSNQNLRIFWWTNLVYVVLWFLGATFFYLFQCSPSQWYFLQYYARYHKPVPGGKHGQCDSTSVLHTALPVIFSLISDVGLLSLPIWAISKLKVNRNKKIGLVVVFGIGLVAAFLELARILELLVDTDDKGDTSYGVAVFLILTAAEETTAVVCACVPVIIPQLYKVFKGNNSKSSYVYNRNGDPNSSGKRSDRGFKRVASLNHIWTMPTTINDTKVDPVNDDGIPLTSIEITGNPTLENGDEVQQIGNRKEYPRFSQPQPFGTNHIGQATEPNFSNMSNIQVHTDIQVHVDNAPDQK
ncbi:hypothetical protein M426DRAFT_11654 [Hypoxylon sp. CI-4A]|nr:hypothetical protein M426DRAFT_11654 [Hypoxylon sp. CI-4A]